MSRDTCWYFGLSLKAILPDLDGVITLFILPFLLFNLEFYGKLTVVVRVCIQLKKEKRTHAII
jgi:hypothetical protein